MTSRCGIFSSDNIVVGVSYELVAVLSILCPSEYLFTKSYLIKKLKKTNITTNRSTMVVSDHNRPVCYIKIVLNLGT